MVDDNDDRAQFFRGVRRTLSLIEEELAQTRVGRQAVPTSEALRDVQRNLQELVDRPRVGRGKMTRGWDGRAARLVKDWPGDNPVRHAVLRLWTQYSRGFSG